MRSEDIPQVASFQAVREVLTPLRMGPRTRAELALESRVALRHVQYRVHAARVFGWVDASADRLTLTAAGARLLATGPGSDSERGHLVVAFRESATIRRLDEDLTGPFPPPLSRLAGKIHQLAGLARATAERRAGDLLKLHAEAFSRGAALFVRDDPSAGPPVRIPRRRTGLVISRVAVANFGPIRELAAELEPLTVIIGRNATGKSTFLDTIGFVSDALEDGVDRAVLARADRFEELLHNGGGSAFLIEIDVDLSAEARRPAGVERAHYRLEVGAVSGAPAILSEELWLGPAEPFRPRAARNRAYAWRKVLSNSRDGQAWYGAETSGWKTTFNVGPGRLALRHLPPDDAKFPVTLRLQRLLWSRVQRLNLRAEAMREPCSPLAGLEFDPSGSNLPLVVRALDASRKAAWVRDVQEALSDVVDIRVIEREEDKHLYLKLTYRGGVHLPTWRLSDGTLRVLALTLLPYCALEDSVFLIEEPENGIHPQAIESVFEALRAPVRFQALVATHSPVFVGVAEPAQLLCFSKPSGATTAIRGDAHPALVDWKRGVDIATLFAADVLR